jgi:two-component system response regulator WspF
MISKSGNSKDEQSDDMRSVAASAIPLVAIGASAGGPSALATIVRDLPRNFSAAIVIVQHIDVEFAISMATWLQQDCRLPVRVARHRERPEPGTILVAATNDHLVCRDSQTLGYVEEPQNCHYKPSIDVFFDSVASHWRGSVAAALLTGMGRDGAKGLKSLRDSGALTIAQDAKSSVVYGMPKAAAELNAAVEVLPLERIAFRLVNWQLFCNQRKTNENFG